MSAPVGYTCPTIDEVIAAIEHGISALKELQAQLPNLEDLEHPANYDNEIELLEGSLNRMEEIRSANDSLRSWGTDNEEEKERLEALSEELERELADEKEEKENFEMQLNQVEAERDSIRDERDAAQAEIEDLCEQLERSLEASEL